MPDSAPIQRRAVQSGSNAAEVANELSGEIQGAVGNNVSRRVLPATANIVAAGQFVCLALIVLFDLVADSRMRAVSAGQIINAVFLLCGFGLVVNHWMTREVHGFVDAIWAIGERVALVGGLILLAALFATEIGGGIWYELHLARTLAVMMVIISAGTVVPLTIKYLARTNYFARVKYFIRSRATPRCIVIFGDEEPTFAVAQRLRTQLNSTDVCLYPVASLRPNAGSPESLVNPFYADPRLIELAPDVAVITSFANDKETMARIILELAPLPIDVVMSAKDSELWGPGPLTMLAGIPFVRLFPKSLAWHNKVMKRVFDILIAAVLLLLLLPLFLIVALLIKLDSRGPVFFRQPRVGLGGSHFMVYKFRTMRVEATDLLADKQTVANDPRITPVGAFLRKSSIDELPQLFNVLLGSMSLVGPRPHPLNCAIDGSKFSNVVANYHARHRVKPGITGLAQVLGWRGAADTRAKIEQRVANDLRYISEWSLARDFILICRTIFALCGKNAF